MPEIGILARDFFIFLIFAIVAWSCAEISDTQRQRISASLSDSLVNRSETWDLHLSIIEEGLRKVEIWAPYAVSMINDTASFTQISGPVLIHIFDSTRAKTQTINTDELTYYSRTSLYLLRGNVDIVNSDSTRLKTSYLEWNQNERRIFTPEFVEYTSPTDSISGFIFTANDDLSNYELTDVRGKVVVDEEE